MPTLAIESNGRIEKTAVYYNGEQVAGIKELVVNISEEGDFDCIIQYTGLDKEIYTKQIFSEELLQMKFTEPAFTEEESKNLVQIAIESEGDLENTFVFDSEGQLDGLVRLYIHLKAPTVKKSLFGKEQVEENANFIAQISYRNEDDSIETESIF